LDDWFDKRERTPESIEESNIMIETKVQYRLRNTLKIKVYYDNGEIKY